MTVPCWRCRGAGHLGFLRGGAYLICRLCHGSGSLAFGRPSLRQRIRSWWQGFKERHWVKEYPWNDPM